MYRVNTPELPQVCSICGGFPSPWPGSDFFTCLTVATRTSVLYPAMAVQ